MRSNDHADLDEPDPEYVPLPVAFALRRFATDIELLIEGPVRGSPEVGGYRDIWGDVWKSEIDLDANGFGAGGRRDGCEYIG